MKFTEIKTIHKNKYEIHKNRTLGKKPKQTPDVCIYKCMYVLYVKCVCFYALL